MHRLEESAKLAGRAEAHLESLDPHVKLKVNR